MQTRLPARRGYSIPVGSNLQPRSAGMSPNPEIPCQNGRFSARFRARAAGWQGGNSPRSVKKRAGELSVWNISPPQRAFSCGKNEISLLKEISSLPQRRKIPAAKKFPGEWKARKNEASGHLFRLFGDFPRAKPECLLASLYARRADAGTVSVRTASRGRRQSVAENEPAAFILRSRRLARFACFRPSPSLRPSVRFSRNRF